MSWKDADRSQRYSFSVAEDTALDRRLARPGVITKNFYGELIRR